MSSSTFVDTAEDKDDQLIIIVNADGTITVDPETLQKLIANQHGGNLSVVRVGDNLTPDDSQEDGESDGGGPHVNLTVEGFYPEQTESEILQPDGADASSEVVDPFSQMEPEHIARLESVLQSEQAKEILGTNLVEDNNLNSMLDILEGKDEVSPAVVHNDHSYTTAVPAYQQTQTQVQNQPVQQPSLHRPLTRGGRGRGRGRGLMTRGGRGGNTVVHQVVVPPSSPSQSSAKVVQASPQKTFVVTPPSHPRVIAQPIVADEEQTPKVIHRRTLLTKIAQPSPQLKQQTLHQALHPSTPPISIPQDTGASPTVITSTPLVIQRKVPVTRGGRGRGGRGGRGGRRRNSANGDEVSAALQAMELSSTQPQPTLSPIVSSPSKQQPALQQQSQTQPQSEPEIVVKKKPPMPTVIIRKIGSKSEIVTSTGKGNKVRHHTEDSSPEQYTIIQPQPQATKAVKQVVIQKSPEPVTPTRVTAKELGGEDSSLRKKKEKKAILSSPPVENLGPELFSTPDIIRRVSTDKPGDVAAPQTPTQVEPKVQVQLTHPPFKPIINCGEMTPESLLDSIHAEVAAKDDSRLIAEALLLDDLTNDDSQSMSYPGKDKTDPVRTAPTQPQQQTPQSQQQNHKILESQTPRIRKLPPIELPATRSATKKAQASQQTNSAPQHQTSRSSNPHKEKKHVAAIVTEKRYSTEKKIVEREKKFPIKDDFVSDFEDEEAETDEESWNSEDDPDRLWCICKKPHNNRFMICCDGCEEWFHGKCVGITKAIGQQMESNGIEWSCPNCEQAKSQNNKKVQETTKPATTTPSTKLPSGQQTISSLECIVCKKPAKVDSNYCGDICVRKHALTMLALLKKETDSLQLSSRVVVYEKKSGKLLAGNAAPTVQILADWLLEHQSYEIAKPSVLPPNKFYKKPATVQQAPSPQAAQQKQQSPSKQVLQHQTPVKLQQQVQQPKQQVQAPPKTQLKQQLLPQAKQQLQQPPTQVKQPQQQQAQVKQQPPQVKQQQQAQQTLTKQLVKQQPQPTKQSVNKQVVNEKGSNLKQTVLTQKITASGTKEIGYAPKQPTTPHKIQIIQAQPLSLQQPIGKIKAKEEEEAKSKKSVSKINVQSSPEPTSKRPSIDGKKSVEKSSSKEDKRRDSISSNKDKDEKKKDEKKKRKDSINEVIKSEETTPVPGATQSVEPVRANVKRTLQELLSQRVKQDDSVNISNDEIKELVSSIEEELFALFKDTGTKYKSKYRSLVFNIKDPKNLTLYKKIVEKLISPTQLVRLSPEELASQELAQWREKEAKHQLEIIKKNELDLIHQAKTVVLKSRKGEEVIESKAINISELESALNRTADDYEVEKPTISEVKEEEKSPEKKSEKKKEERSSRLSERKRKKEERSRRDRSRSRSRRRSRSRSRDREKKRKEKDNDRIKEKERDNKRDDKAEETLKEIEEVISQHISIPPPPPSQPDSDLSDREPSSTVNISTPPLEEEKPPVWRGILNMTEVTKLYTSAYEVSGSCEDLGEELSDQLDCVGRIQPDSVWEYVSRMKKAGTKDIIVIRFHSDAEEEKMNYLSLYSYLNSRNRMAVIGQVSKTVKDFYVLPLASHSPIPQVLLPLDGPGFDDYRTHLLLGIIIRTRKGSAGTINLPSRSKKSGHISSSSRSERSYTPPLPADGGTPPTTPPPLPPFSKPYSHPPGLTPPLPDDDEPYSPGEDDLYSPEDNQTEAILVNPEIQRNLEEVNRMIEQKRQQIQSIAQAAAGTQVPVAMDEETPYSPSSSFTPPRQGTEAIPFLDTNEIKLPPDLQDILASIKGTPTMDPKSDPIVKAYTSQAYYEEEEDLKEEEKDIKSERTSRDPRQRPDPPKPKSALSQLSDSELIRKAAEMESEEKKEFKQPQPTTAYYYTPPPPAVAPQPIYPPPPSHYKYPSAQAPPPPPPMAVDKDRKRKDKFKERRPPPPPPPLPPHPQRRKWDGGHHNRGMMQHRPPMRGNRSVRYRGGFDRGRGGFRGNGGFRPQRGGGGAPRFRGSHGRDRNVQSEWDEEIRNFEQRKARERKRSRASRSPSPRRRSISPPRRRSRRASSNSS